MKPRVFRLGFLTSVDLYCVVSAHVRILNRSALNDHNFPISRALRCWAEEAPRAIGDTPVHGLADDLGDEETRFGGEMIWQFGILAILQPLFPAEVTCGDLDVKDGNRIRAIDCLFGL